jgi:hypothetical protein
MSDYSLLRFCGAAAPVLACATLSLLLSVAGPASGQEATPSQMHDEADHQHHAPPAPKTTQPTTGKKAAEKKHTHPSAAADHAHRKQTAKNHAHVPGSGTHQNGTGKTHTHAGMPASTYHHPISGMEQNHREMEMKGLLGPYPIAREGSGTSWLPDSSAHEGIHSMYGDWMFMGHGLINAVYDRQGGPRGGDKTFAGGMLMGTAERPLGDGTLGFRTMLSPDPFMGRNGYPLLFATGETADGKTPLIDRQHPHDLFMELAGSYSRTLSANSSVFLYAGLPGEPALGPSAFMHRTSGMDIPEAPITHHWLDSTHITYGVVTLGAVFDRWKIEASTFRGREPDQYRFDIEEPRLDSFSARLSWNPVRELSMQVSWGRLHSPEQLSPDVDQHRITASITYTQPFGADNLWSSTFAWGRKTNRPGNTLDGYLIESELIFKKTYTLFMRAERVAEDELLDVPVLADFGTGAPPIFTVTKVTTGGIYDFPIAEHLKFGVGGLVSKYGVPGDLKPVYSRDPTSYMAFFRLKVL